MSEPKFMKDEKFDELDYYDNIRKNTGLCKVIATPTLKTPYYKVKCSNNKDQHFLSEVMMKKYDEKKLTGGNTKKTKHTRRKSYKNKHRKRQN